MPVTKCAASCVLASYFLAVLLVTSATQWSEDGVTNVALYKTVSLSNVSESESSLAVDGNTDQKNSKHSCINIETEGDIWWQVDLGDVYTIFHIRVIPTEDFYENIADREEDCFNTLWSYEGQINTTRTGRTCQRWDSQSPHRHVHKPELFWYRGENFLTENYCRAADYTIKNPWCYTTDPKLPWDYCNVYVEECKYVPVLSSNINLKTGTHVDNLVNTVYVEDNEMLQRTWEFLLTHQIQARYVKLHQSGSDGHYHLCEIEIYGTKGMIIIITRTTVVITETFTNVALYKITEMSSTYMEGSKKFGPNLAVDGIRNQKFNAGSCFHSGLNDNYPWWRIDFGDTYMIYMMRIYNRVDCCSNRAHDLSLSFWITPEEMFKLILAGSITDIHNFYTAIVARFVKLSLPGHGPFHLCEVELYGKIAECRNNPCKNGGNCSASYCNDSKTCRDYTCTCPTGYGGADCGESVENVAIGKDIIVSSTRYPSWLPSNAIDGDINQYVVNGATCVSTQKETNPYLIIDLGTEYTLSSVKVYKRLDCCSDDVAAFQLFLMVKTWTSYHYTYDSTEVLSKFVLNPFVFTRLVRLQTKGKQPTVMQLCEIEAFAVRQEESNIRIINEKSKPFMQMRFSLSDKYNDVVKSEDSFIHSVRQQLSNHSGFPVENFRNVQLEKDPLRVSFELHSNDGNLRTLTAMLEKVEQLFKQGVTNMETGDGHKLTIIAGSLQYYVMYSGNTGVMLNGLLLTAVCIFMTLITRL